MADTFVDSFSPITNTTTPTHISDPSATAASFLLHASQKNSNTPPLASLSLPSTLPSATNQSNTFVGFALPELVLLSSNNSNVNNNGNGAQAIQSQNQNLNLNLNHSVHTHHSQVSNSNHHSLPPPMTSHELHHQQQLGQQLLTNHQHLQHQTMIHPHDHIPPPPPTLQQSTVSHQHQQPSLQLQSQQLPPFPTPIPPPTFIPNLANGTEPYASTTPSSSSAPITKSSNSSASNSQASKKYKRKPTIAVKKTHKIIKFINPMTGTVTSTLSNTSSKPKPKRKVKQKKKATNSSSVSPGDTFGMDIIPVQQSNNPLLLNSTSSPLPPPMIPSLSHTPPGYAADLTTSQEHVNFMTEWQKTLRLIDPTNTSASVALELASLFSQEKKENPAPFDVALIYKVIAAAFSRASMTIQLPLETENLNEYHDNVVRSSEVFDLSKLDPVSLKVLASLTDLITEHCSEQVECDPARHHVLKQTRMILMSAVQQQQHNEIQMPFLVGVAGNPLRISPTVPMPYPPLKAPSHQP